jgi:hypothetical protein
MAELISAMVLSLGAVWTASIAAGASRAASAPDDWEAAQNAMQFAWLSAMPLILAVLVALSPRVTATGAGVKRGRSTVLATLVGAVTCVGLIEVVMTHTSSILSARASAAPAGTSEPGAKSAVAVRPVQKPVAKQKPAKTRPQPGSASSIGTSSPAVTPAGELERIVLAFESEQTKLSIDVKVDGPMLPRDARQGVEKSFERLVNCYEASERRGDPSELRLGLLIDDAGSVKQAELIEPAGSTSKYVTCVQLAFYRSGFSAPPKLTWLELSVSFLPKEWTGTR